MTDTREIQEKTWTMRPFPLAIKIRLATFYCLLPFLQCTLSYVQCSVLLEIYSRRIDTCLFTLSLRNENTQSLF